MNFPDSQAVGRFATFEVRLEALPVNSPKRAVVAPESRWVGLDRISQLEPAHERAQWPSCVNKDLSNISGDRATAKFNRFRSTKDSLGVLWMN
jgi:hypothetical protein